MPELHGVCNVKLHGLVLVGADHCAAQLDNHESALPIANSPYFTIVFHFTKLAQRNAQLKIDFQPPIVLRCP